MAGVDGLRREVSLPELAPQLPQLDELPLVLDALGDDLEPQRLSRVMMARASAELSSPSATWSTNGFAILTPSTGNWRR